MERERAGGEKAEAWGGRRVKPEMGDEGTGGDGWRRRKRRWMAEVLAEGQRGQRKAGPEGDRSEGDEADGGERRHREVEEEMEPKPGGEAEGWRSKVVGRGEDGSERKAEMGDGNGANGDGGSGRRRPGRRRWKREATAWTATGGVGTGGWSGGGFEGKDGGQRRRRARPEQTAMVNGRSGQIRKQGGRWSKKNGAEKWEARRRWWWRATAGNQKGLGSVRTERTWVKAEMGPGGGRER